MTSANVLAKELAFFQRERDNLLKHYEGQVALIKDDTLVGTYSTMQQAVQAGLSKFGNVPFLAKPIVKDEASFQAPALTLGLISASF